MKSQFSNLDMFCPVCRKELVEWEMLPLETLDEHVCNPNGEPSMKMAYRCSDENCVTRTRNIFWNDIGEMYARPYLRSAEQIPFIDNNDAPFGTFQRKTNVTICKKNENKTLVTLPKWFPGVLSGMEIRSRWCYKSNENGDILKRKLHFDYLRKKGDGQVYHQWGMNMLIFCLKGLFKQWKDLRKNPDDKFAIRELRGDIERGTWKNAEWWRKWNATFAYIILATCSNGSCKFEKNF